MSKSFSMAMNIHRRNKAKKMAQGGEVSRDNRTVGEIIGFPGSTPVKKAKGGMIEDAPKSIAEAIRRKRKAKEEEASEPEADEPLEPIEDDLDEDAGEKDPEDDDQGLNKRNRIANIRKKNRKR